VFDGSTRVLAATAQEDDGRNVCCNQWAFGSN